MTQQFNSMEATQEEKNKCLHKHLYTNIDKSFINDNFKWK